MVKILADIYTQEEKVNRLALAPDSATKVFSYFRTKVFEKNQVADSTFRISLNYYMDHPKEMEAVYATLIDTLQLREQRAPTTAQP